MLPQDSFFDLYRNKYFYREFNLEELDIENDYSYDYY